MSYSDQTSWSDPRALGPYLAELPAEPLALADSLENFLIHHAAAQALGFGVPEQAEADRNLRSVERLLSTALARDQRPLSAKRDLPAYLYGTCHDFALLAAARLRAEGVEARLRVGFVDYFKPGHWEDHWLCEYREGGTWLLLDAQLGRRAREGHGIAFDVTEVPDERFRSSCALWLALRRGEIDPEVCGVSFAGISGAWFPATNLLKEVAALAGIEALPWDFWGPAESCARDRQVPPAARPQFDALAEAFLTPPATPAEAGERLADFAWARPGPSVLSFVDGRLVERPIL